MYKVELRNRKRTVPARVDDSSAPDHEEGLGQGRLLRRDKGWIGIRDKGRAMCAPGQAAISADFFMRTRYGNRLGMRNKIANLTRVALGMGHVVSVKSRNKRAVPRSEPRIHGGRNTITRLADQIDTPVSGHERPHNVCGAIAAAIINNKKPQVRRGLCKHRSDRVADRSGGVSGRDDNIARREGHVFSFVGKSSAHERPTRRDVFGFRFSREPGVA